MTRIIGGSAGGRRITTPRGAATRPTTDRVREALFSAVEAWCGSLHGLRFLDLYAGSGRGRARGLVARRRRGHPGRAGPAHRRPDRGATPARLGFARADVVAGAGRARRCAGTPAAPYDVVFLDPPYPLADADRRRRPGRAGATTAGWCPGRWSSSSARRAAPSPAWPDGLRRPPGAQVRRDGALVRSRRVPADAPEDPRGGDAVRRSRLPRVVRPGHQRAPRHRRAAPSTLFDEVVVAVGVNASQEPALHRRGAHRRCSDEACADLANVRVDGLHGPAHRLLPGAGRPRDRQGPARGQRLRLRAARWRR